MVINNEDIMEQLKEIHLSKGTTKEGKKVVGYYYRNEISGRMTITWIEKAEPTAMQEAGAERAMQKQTKENTFTVNSGCERCVEITSPPQKCLGIRDCEGELVFEGDEFYNSSLVDALKNEKHNISSNGYRLVSRSILYKIVYNQEETRWEAKPSENQGRTYHGEKLTNTSLFYLEMYKMKIIHPTNKEVK